MAEIKSLHGDYKTTSSCLHTNSYHAWVTCTLAEIENTVPNIGFLLYGGSLYLDFTIVPKLIGTKSLLTQLLIY